MAAQVQLGRRVPFGLEVIDPRRPEPTVRMAPRRPVAMSGWSAVSSSPALVATGRRLLCHVAPAGWDSDPGWTPAFLPALSSFLLDGLARPVAAVEIHRCRYPFREDRP